MVNQLKNIDTNLKILSWNIQASNNVSGSKFGDPEFCKILNQNHIICLQETRQNVKFPGYRAFNNTRRDEKNGGVCTLVKNGLADGLQKINTSIPDLIVCKVKKSYFNLNSDIFIINVYIKPANSSSMNSANSGHDTLKELDTLINDLQNHGQILICGDFNARIANENDFIMNDKDSTDSFIPLPDDYIPDNLLKRNSQDNKTNSYRRPFLEMLLNNKIHILNGRTLGDFKGQFTCIQITGSSVVDYFITSTIVRNLVNHMTILPFTPYSDHKPIAVSLQLDKILNYNSSKINEMYDKAPLRYKFSRNDKDSYKDIQDNPDMKNLAQDILTETYSDDTDGTYRLNEDFTKYLTSLADQTLKKTKHLRDDVSNKQPWFNYQCRAGKRLLNKAARTVSSFPDSDFLRINYYKVKKKYKKILKTNKSRYFDSLNKDIEEGKILNWKQFKRLKIDKSSKVSFDALDMSNFEKKFKVLYSNEYSAIPNERKEELLLEADARNDIHNNNNNSSILDDANNILNRSVTLDEIKTSINSLKNGKSSSDDMICNELLISLKANGVDILHKLFNKCFDTGSYPWNNSIITPLHKKGSKDDPDNYRAIAVCSTIGKLFSTILLNRLIDYRNSTCPDPQNQLGFTKGAQTYDHILTLNTITSKYKKLKKKVYTVFVDFKKAFDSVCREALFYKLSIMGVKGKFYSVLRHMYSNSTAQIKLSGHISNKFKIEKGTEQGHPLSPDLFKIFLSDLSPLLEHSNCPQLMHKIVSHLLWADDLVILALDKNTLQIQLDSLINFCTKWGIEINISKTKLMIFNKGIYKDISNNMDNSINTSSHTAYSVDGLHSTHQANNSEAFYLGDRMLEEVDTYCYLGINIHNSGSLAHVRQELRKKAMRSLYYLKRTVNKTKLSIRSLCTLFDSLIKPVVLYGAPLWCPSMSVVKSICKQISSTASNIDHASLLRKTSLINCEKVHLNFLKWALGVNRLASNLGSWGETGRYPLVYECLNLTLKYVKRLQSLDNNSLVFLAFKEQQTLKLEWFRCIEPVLKMDKSYEIDHVTAYKNSKSHSVLQKHVPPQENFLIHNGFVKRIPTQTIKPTISQSFTPHIIMKLLKSQFKDSWQHTKNTSPKLEFYNSIKHVFSKETYLDHVNNFYDRANLTKLRISAHDLQIELGRRNNVQRQDRHCKWCNISLDFRTLENEQHFLYSCDLYSALRQNCLQIISKITGTKILRTNFMSLLNHINSFSATSNSTYFTSHCLVIDPNTPPHTSAAHGTPHNHNIMEADNFYEQLKVSSVVVARTIAKLVTRCFDHRKNLLSHRTAPFT